MQSKILMGKTEDDVVDIKTKIFLQYESLLELENQILQSLVKMKTYF